MKITFELDTNDASDANAIAILLGQGNPTPPAVVSATTTPTSTKGRPAVEKPETVAAKKKRLAAEKKVVAAAAAKKAEAAKQAEAAEADDLMDDGNAGEVTLDDLKAVVKTAIERTDIDQVKAVFKDHKAAKISDLATETYAAVKDALEAL